MTARVEPASATTPDLQELFDRLGRRADGAPYNVMATIALHPELLRRFTSLLLHTLTKSTLSARDRELVILRVGVLCRSSYEFAQHAVIAECCGLSAAEVDRVKSGPSAMGWSDTDRDLLRAVDELHHDSTLSDKTWAALARRYSIQQILDILATVGNYHLVAFVVNACAVELDPGVDDVL